MATELVKETFPTENMSVITDMPIQRQRHVRRDLENTVHRKRRSLAILKHLIYQSAICLLHVLRQCKNIVHGEVCTATTIKRGTAERIGWNLIPVAMPACLKTSLTMTIGKTRICAMIAMTLFVSLGRVSRFLLTLALTCLRQTMVMISR